LQKLNLLQAAFRFVNVTVKEKAMNVKTKVKAGKLAANHNTTVR